jgi:hypothetical protein
VSPRDYTFTDRLLFEGGLMKVFEDIAARIEKGEL